MDPIYKEFGIKKSWQKDILGETERESESTDMSECVYVCMFV